MTRPAHPRGIASVLLSAFGFAAMPLWMKDAYTHGFSPGALVAVRFVLVAVVFWAIVLVRGAHRHAGTPRRAVVGAFVLGLTCYALENRLYFAAVDRLAPGIVALVLAVYPALVVAGAIALGREHADLWRVGALGLALAGAALVLAGGASGGALDIVGVLLALAGAVTYATYLLLGDTLISSLDPFLLSALASSGAAVSLSLAAGVTGAVALPSDAVAWRDLAGLVLLSSVVPLGALWTGVRMIGAPTASIVASVEPAITVTLAAVLLGEQLGNVQLVGGALLVSAVVLLNTRSIGGDDAAADLPLVAPTGALAHEPA